MAKFLNLSEAAARAKASPIFATTDVGVPLGANCDHTRRAGAERNRNEVIIAIGDCAQQWRDGETAGAAQSMVWPSGAAWITRHERKLMLLSYGDSHQRALLEAETPCSVAAAP